MSFAAVKYTIDNESAIVSTDFIKDFDSRDFFIPGDLKPVFWSPDPDETPDKLLAAQGVVQEIDKLSETRKRQRKDPMPGYYQAEVLKLGGTREELEESDKRWTKPTPKVAQLLKDKEGKKPSDKEKEGKKPSDKEKEGKKPLDKEKEGKKPLDKEKEGKKLVDTKNRKNRGSNPKAVKAGEKSNIDLLLNEPRSTKLPESDSEDEDEPVEPIKAYVDKIDALDRQVKLLNSRNMKLQTSVKSLEDENRTLLAKNESLQSEQERLTKLNFNLQAMLLDSYSASKSSSSVSTQEAQQSLFKTSVNGSVANKRSPQSVKRSASTLSPYSSNLKYSNSPSRSNKKACSNDSPSQSSWLISPVTSGSKASPFRYSSKDIVVTPDSKTSPLPSPSKSKLMNSSSHKKNLFASDHGTSSPLPSSPGKCLPPKKAQLSPGKCLPPKKAQLSPGKCLPPKKAQLSPGKCLSPKRPHSSPSKGSPAKKFKLSNEALKTASWKVWDGPAGDSRWAKNLAEAIFTREVLMRSSCTGEPSKRYKNAEIKREAKPRLPTEKWEYLKEKFEERIDKDLIKDDEESARDIKKRKNRLGRIIADKIQKLNIIKPPKPAKKSVKNPKSPAKET